MKESIRFKLESVRDRFVGHHIASEKGEADFADLFAKAFAESLSQVLAARNAREALPTVMESVADADASVRLAALASGKR